MRARKNGATICCPCLSIETATTARSRWSNVFCKRSSEGNSRTHGKHHVAQKFNTTIFPRNRRRFTGVPSIALKPISGAIRTGRSHVSWPTSFRKIGDDATQLDVAIPKAHAAMITLFSRSIIRVDSANVIDTYCYGRLLLLWTDISRRHSTMRKRKRLNLRDGIAGRGIHPRAFRSRA